MRASILMACLVLASAAARADTISFTSQVPPTGYDAYGGAGFQVDSFGFDSRLGTLDGVTMGVSGSVQDSLLAYSGDTVPFAAVFNNIGTISGAGLDQGIVVSQDNGIASSFLASNAFAVSATFSTTQDLQDYAASAVVATTYMFYSTVTATATGQTVPYDSDYAQFTGTVTETFSYTPTEVPEPGSAALLAFGLLAITVLARKRAARAAMPALSQR